MKHLKKPKRVVNVQQRPKNLHQFKKLNQKLIKKLNPVIVSSVVYSKILMEKLFMLDVILARNLNKLLVRL